MVNRLWLNSVPSTCIPCKQMKPILEQLAADYKDKLNVPIVEVYE